MTIEELAEKLGIELTDESRQEIEAFAAAEVAALKATNRKLKDEKRTITEKLNALNKLDIEAIAEAIGQDIDDFDLDELPDLIDQLKVKDDDDGKQQTKDNPRIAELERKLDRAKKRGEDDLAQRDDQITKLTKAIGENSLKADASEVIAAAAGSVKGLMPHVKGRVKTEVDEDGQVDLVILAANGEPMEDSKGNPASLKDLVEELRRDEDLGGLFKSGLGGSDTKPNRGGPGSNKKWSEMNLDERSALKQSNPVLYDRMKSAA